MYLLSSLSHISDYVLSLFFYFEIVHLAERCPEGYDFGYDYGCYRFVTSRPRTWLEARQDCQSVEDGDLLIVETVEEVQFLLNLNATGDWWIGEFTFLAL